MNLKVEYGISQQAFSFQKISGIIGIGHIGKELVRLKAFNCKIFANDVIDQTDYYRKMQLETSKDEIFKTCDFVTINTPHNADTHNMVDINVLKSMKNSTYIINIARGGIINETDLKKALKNIIAGAALDAYVKPPCDQELVLPILYARLI